MRTYVHTKTALKSLLIQGVFALCLCRLLNFILEAKEPYKVVLFGFKAFLIITGLALLYYYLRHLVPLRREEPGFPIVYVKDDGTVREVTEDEWAYLNWALPSDGGKPDVSLKTRYLEKFSSGGISGFIPRRRVPVGIIVSEL